MRKPVTRSPSLQVGVVALVEQRTNVVIDRRAQVISISNESEVVIGILAVDNLNVDQDDRSRLQRIDSGSITYEQALYEVSEIAREVSQGRYRR